MNIETIENIKSQKEKILIAQEKGMNLIRRYSFGFYS